MAELIRKLILSAGDIVDGNKKTGAFSDEISVGLLIVFVLFF